MMEGAARQPRQKVKLRTTPLPQRVPQPPPGQEKKRPENRDNLHLELLESVTQPS